MAIKKPDVEKTPLETLQEKYDELELENRVLRRDYEKVFGWWKRVRGENNDLATKLMDKRIELEKLQAHISERIDELEKLKGIEARGLLYR
jgi:chromosome segregation ATPase